MALFYRKEIDDDASEVFRDYSTRINAGIEPPRISLRELRRLHKEAIDMAKNNCLDDVRLYVRCEVLKRENDWFRERLR